MGLTRPKAAQINFDLTNISDPILRLNSDKTDANDTDIGFIFERGSTGDNAVLVWDESADVFVIGTTTATGAGASTGDLTISQVGLHAGSITINSAYTFPTADGTANQVLTTDGSGTISFADASGVAKTSATGSAEIPSGTTQQRDGSPSAGFLRFNSTDTSFEGYDGSAWGAIGGGGGASGGGTDAIFYENGKTVTTNYTLTADTNAMTTGPLTINSGVSVTVPSGSRWVVL